MASAASSKARSASRCMAFQKNRVEWQRLSLTSSVENTCPMPSEGQRRLGCSQEASAVDRAKLATAAEPVEPCGTLQRQLTPSNSRVTGLTGKLLNLTSANSVDSLMYPLPIYAQKDESTLPSWQVFDPYFLPFTFASSSKTPESALPVQIQIRTGRNRCVCDLSEQPKQWPKFGSCCASSSDMTWVDS